MRLRLRGAATFLLLAAAVAGGCENSAQRVEEVPRDWREDWEVLDGFAVDIDSEGYRFPTSIAFVPNPGPGPGDPAYFVSEIEGTIKVVTNDRTVSTFATDFFRLELPHKLPDMRAEFGLGALALDPVHGYVFASFGYRDPEGVLRNDIIRFRTTPRTFSREPSESIRFTDVFKDFRSSRSHQIGHMAVDGETLWVAVGNGLQLSAGQDLSNLNGKVLRMTLDGRPAAGNPFASDKDEAVPADFVWAYGLRNPFGLLFAEGAVFAAENGPSVDRFLRIERGRNYGYDGTDWSMGTHALAVIAPAVGPAQAAWLAAGAEQFPFKYRSAFYVAFAGSPLAGPGPGRSGEKSVAFLTYDKDRNEITAPPRVLVRYRGSEIQMPVGVAFGPDALYFVPLFPVRDGRGAILRVGYDPQRSHPFRIERTESPLQLMASYGCNGCHVGYGGRESVGPSLDPPALVARVDARINSPAYAAASAELDASDAEPYAAFVAERAQIADASGKEKIRLWLKYHLLHPGFDNRESMMPTQDLDAADAGRLADYFVEAGWGETPAENGDDRSLETWRTVIGPPRWRYVLLSILLGVAGGFVLAARRRGGAHRS